MSGTLAPNLHRPLSGRDPRVEHYMAEALAYYGCPDLLNEPLLSVLPILDPFAATKATRSTLKTIPLPAWASDIAPDGIPVPAALIDDGDNDIHERVDWSGTVAWFLHGIAERAYEAENGPIHSNSYLLKDWCTKLWDKPWVNMIVLFLQRWASAASGNDGPPPAGLLPQGETVITHDVDAVRKTSAIRLKQTAFLTYNALRFLVCGKLALAIARFGQALRFLFLPGDYWCFPRIRELEREHNVLSHFNVYGGTAVTKNRLKQWLFDPAYDVAEKRLADQLQNLVKEGCIVGLHQSFDSWYSADAMKQERDRVTAASGNSVTTCRQHWLRFSWERTWAAQAEAGFEIDSTLGFNNRPAFRAGAALPFRPWDDNRNGPLPLTILPMVFMDSHFYDYTPMSDSDRHRHMTRWVDEIQSVGGKASVIWHQRVLSQDYGWERGFVDLLKIVKGRSNGE